MEGLKHNARLVVDDAAVWGDLTAADLVRRLFRLAAGGWSTPRLAAEFNRLGVPTSNSKQGRGVRGTRTQDVWHPGHVLRILKSTTYRGEFRYGKRSKKLGREVIKTLVPAIVGDELWRAVQDALARRARQPGSYRRSYLLRSLIRCGICGLTYTGTVSHDDVWYRCNGQLVERGPVAGRCPGKSIKGDHIEQVVWADVERFLRHPGDLLIELRHEMEAEVDTHVAIAEAERVTLQAALNSVNGKKGRLIDLYADGPVSRGELDRRISKLDGEREAIEGRLTALLNSSAPPPEPIDRDLQAELLLRLEHGLTPAERQEVASYLVRDIRIETTIAEDGTKHARVVISYNFPVVEETDTDTGSSQPPS